jgi:fused signal recognition particle receptor
VNLKEQKLVKMFGFLKEKLKKVVSSISEKLKEKEVVEEKKEEIPKIEEKPIEIPEEKEEVVVEEPEIVEEVPEVKPEIPKEEPKVEEKIPEIKPEVKIEPPKEKPKVEVKPIEEVKVTPEKPKKGFFKRITEKIVKKVVEKRLSEEDVMPVLNELENGLIESDVAYEVAEKIKNDLKNSLVDKEIKRGKEKEVVVEALRNSLLGILTVPEVDLKEMVKNKKPVILLFLGFNGSGKTTSLAKVGKWLIDEGYSCVFAAADTFRAASLEQLEEHGAKIGVKVIKHRYGSDPAAVAFDAIAHAKANGIDFVLIDSAGRAHTNKNLMDQMKKIIKVNNPDLKILVIDSLTGNDAVLQARAFNEIDVSGVIFTKVDVNEKGGAILSVTHELKKPILFLGVGQKYEEFEKFDKEKFVNNLLI